LHQRTSIPPNRHSTIYKARITPRSPKIPAAPGTTAAGIAAPLDVDVVGPVLLVGAIVVPVFAVEPF
jgi:hypothetical protein